LLRLRPAAVRDGRGCFSGDGRKKHPVCPICVKLKVPTTYWCCVNCPGNPGAWRGHTELHKQVRRHRRRSKDGGVMQQQHHEAAEVQAQYAAQTGDEYSELLAKGLRYASKEDLRREAYAFRDAIALRPDRPVGYFNLGIALTNSTHYAEAAQRFLEAKERYPVGSEGWAEATARAFSSLTQEECADVAKPDWWNDEGLKALSARVVRAVPDDMNACEMRAAVLSPGADVLGGVSGIWGAVVRSAAELKEAATYFERAAALCPAPVMRADFTDRAAWCRTKAETM